MYIPEHAHVAIATHILAWTVDGKAGDVLDQGEWAESSGYWDALRAYLCSLALNTELNTYTLR